MVKTNSEAGFTLLEVLVVLAIITLAYGLALPRIGSNASPAATEAESLRLIAALNNVRYSARRQNKTLTSVIEPAHNRVKLPDPKIVFQLPNTIHLGIRGIPRCEPSGEKIIFYPDGRSCAPSLILTSASATRRIQINALTGAISLED